MAKGRRLTSSRSERLLGSYSDGRFAASSSSESPEFGEEDVWSIVDGGGGENESLIGDNGDWSPPAGVEIDSRRRGVSRGGRRNAVGGLSLAFDETASSRIVHQYRGHDSVAEPRRHMATSAPVNVPDWSKILRVDSVDSLHDFDDGLDDRDSSEMVPPHEYLAREYARSKKNGGASVFEGVGRTLKGRDLRRVRDAVWSQTGFDG